METISANYKILKKVKDETFDVDKLHDYCLCIQIGIHDFQLCVIDTSSNRCLLIEDFFFENVRTINTRLLVVQKLFENHHLLMAGFWHSIKVSFKAHKFTLVPSDHFVPPSASDYLKVNSQLKEKTEIVNTYKHISSNAVNIFAGDRKLTEWLKSVYKQKQIQIIHQGSAFIEGVHRYDDHSHEKGMYCMLDKGVMHVVVSHDQKLLYYNQFAVKESEDMLRYIMLVFKELSLSQKTSKLIFWGDITPESPHIKLMKRYIRNISLGSKPNYLSFSYHFGEVPDSQYFDVMNILLCE